MKGVSSPYGRHTLWTLHVAGDCLYLARAKNITEMGHGEAFDLIKERGWTAACCPICLTQLKNMIWKEYRYE